LAKEIMQLAAPAQYPRQEIQVDAFPADFSSLFAQRPGLVEGNWPSTQITYLGVYLAKLGCKTLILESHYVDRDYIHDMSVFHALSVRSHPNHCQRLHFFSEAFDQLRWQQLVTAAGSTRNEACEYLQRCYLGFCVVRPLPGSPIGRTVLSTLGPRTSKGQAREFSAAREYRIHLAGFDLHVVGLAFQQQDQGVSACATTALWSSLHRVAHMEGLQIPTPVAITVTGSRYFLGGGRALPSEGLNIYQICEATRAAGLAPLVIQGTSPDIDRAQILGYLSSGFAPVLAIRRLGSSEHGHAVCGVGAKLGEVLPQTDANLHFRDYASALKGVYINDDRLGPYALAELIPITDGSLVRTGLRIRWPDKDVEVEQSLLMALVIPVPIKLRLTVARMRILAFAVAEVTAQLLPELRNLVTFKCRYEVATRYQAAASEYGLSIDGLCQLCCKVVLSRYIGIVEIHSESCGLFDLLLDTTESANASALACVRRGALDETTERKLKIVATRLGAQFVS
jgi:hypothetical protein